MDRRTILTTAVSVALVGSLVGWSLISVSEKSVSPIPKIPGLVIIPWGDRGDELRTNGVIDAKKWAEFYSDRPEAIDVLHGAPNRLVVSRENADVALNLLWAVGLANKNPILTEG